MVLDWRDGPRIEDGGVIYEPQRFLDFLRIPTEADDATIAAAEASVGAAQAKLQEAVERAYRRGRRPTLDEVREAFDACREFMK